MHLRLVLYACCILASGLLVFIAMFALLTPIESKKADSDDNKKTATRTSTSVESGNGNGSGSDCGCNGGTNTLMTPFAQIVARSHGTFPTDAAGWRHVWSSGVLAQVCNDRPRVEFYFAPWCPSCSYFKPIWEESINWFPSRLQRVMVDCSMDCNQPMCAVVQSIPTIIFRRNADDMGIAFTGARTKESLYDFISLLWSAYQRDLEFGTC